MTALTFNICCGLSGHDCQHHICENTKCISVKEENENKLIVFDEDRYVMNRTANIQIAYDSFDAMQKIEHNTVF